jgi:ABC-type sugar transport system ATPase subunit
MKPHVVKPALRVEGIVKTFPAVRALDGVSFDVLPGEVHALLGENGAGKSTLMKTLAGMHQPDEGRIFVEDREVTLPNPIAAKQAGIMLIHQELSLAEDLTVAENVFLGELPTKRFGFVDWKTLHDNTAAILKRLNCTFSPETRVRDLSIAKQQMVEIARALTVEAKAVIFDEPTASLTDQEKTVLFDIIRDLTAQGVGIVYISHRMEEIFHLSDRISVLRDGAYRGTVKTWETNEEEITRLMIGRSLGDLAKSKAGPRGDVVLEVRGLSCAPLFEDVNFSLHAGEVLGLYGLVGAGRTEIAETIFGLRTPSAGEIMLDGEPVAISSPTDAIAKGLALVPESRKEQGLVLGMNCRDNITLPRIDNLTRAGFLNAAAELEVYDKYAERLSIKSPSWRQIVGNLSGGNQQKIVIGKWLAIAPRVLIVDEPTRGIDVGSKAEIQDLIRELAATGYAVLVISSEMPEILRVSDRILALYHGRVIEEFTAEAVTEESLVQAISGLGGDKAAAA